MLAVLLGMFLAPLSLLIMPVALLLILLDVLKTMILDPAGFLEMFQSLDFAGVRELFAGLF